MSDANCYDLISRWEDVPFDKLWGWQKAYWNIYSETEPRFHGILDNLFSSVYWRVSDVPEKKPVNGFIDERLGLNLYCPWTDQKLQQFFSGPNNHGVLCFDEDHESAVHIYLSHPEMHTDYLDWWCASTLAYREVYLTMRAWTFRRLGFFGVVATAFSNSPLLGHSVARLTTAGLWVFSVYLALQGEFLFFGALTAFVLVPTAWARHKRNKLLEEMFSVYLVITAGPGSFSWRVLWDEMARTRKMGAVWPGELYRLVEKKMETV